MNRLNRVFFRTVLVTLGISPLAIVQPVPLVMAERPTVAELVVDRPRQRGAMSSREILERMSAVAHSSDLARLNHIGTSAGGEPLGALLVGDFSAAADDVNRPLTFLFVGTQHGTEPSGGEALLRLAEELASDGGPAHYLKPDGPILPTTARFIIVPNLNPDGRDTNRRRNAASVNLSTDYILLSQSETRSIAGLLNKWRPDVVLDVHESAELKRKSLGAQGYLIDFDAQFEFPNHPSIAAEIRELASAEVLPAAIARTVDCGLPARHYIGEITSFEQTIVHGGLSLRNLRNYAGMRGAVSFLLENRMDSPDGEYETPRNIRERVRRQHVAICSFIESCLDRRDRIRAVVDNANRSNVTPLQPLFGEARHAAIPGRQEIIIRLRRLDTGKPEDRSFDYRGRIIAWKRLPRVDAYVICGHVDEVARLLFRHGIEFSITRGELTVSTTQPCGQPYGRLAAMLLDMESSSSIWRTSAFASADPASPPVVRAVGATSAQIQ